MKYYRVKLEKDGTDIWTKDRNGHYTINTQLVGTELFTEQEMKFYEIPFSWTDQVEINRNDTHFFFGSRFQYGKNSPWMN